MESYKWGYRPIIIMAEGRSSTVLLVILAVVALILIVGAYVFGYSQGVRAAIQPNFGELTSPVSENPFAVRNPFEYQNPFK